MAVYKLSKNHWVMPFFVIFRYVRDILLVTVAFDHPVVYRLCNKWTCAILGKSIQNKEETMGFTINRELGNSWMCITRE